MIPFYLVDVFTTEPFSGNPLAIVSDADLHEASAKLARLDAGQSPGQSAQKSSAP